LQIYIDGDACPVKQEVYRVAERCKLEVTLVANSWMRIPTFPWLKLVVVENNLDAADDWIASSVTENDIVITADIPLASRSLKKGASVLDHKGNVFTEENIGTALASREIMSNMREAGMFTGGPPQFEKKDRSRFLQGLDLLIQRVRRKSGLA
jgi:uncharacterized protein YaiI (UPF0178 family)